eukprot:3995002-Pyramimonas_sp.AAC.1
MAMATMATMMHRRRGVTAGRRGVTPKNSSYVLSIPLSPSISFSFSPTSSMGLSVFQVQADSPRARALAMEELEGLICHGFTVRQCSHPETMRHERDLDFFEVMGGLLPSHRHDHRARVGSDVKANRQFAFAPDLVGVEKYFSCSAAPRIQQADVPLRQSRLAQQELQQA